MANADHLELINQGAGPWNAWREENPDLIPDLESSAFALGEKQWGPEYGGPINLAQARMRNSDLRYATLIGSVMEGADLVGARFFNARLADANLRNADLTEARFDDADVKNAEFDGAILYGADLSTAKNLTVDQIDSAQVDETTLLPANVEKALKKRGWTQETTEEPAAEEVWPSAPPLEEPEPVEAFEEPLPAELEPELIEQEPEPEPVEAVEEVQATEPEPEPEAEELEPVLLEPEPEAQPAEPEPVEPEPEPVEAVQAPEPEPEPVEPVATVESTLEAEAVEPEPRPEQVELEPVESEPVAEAAEPEPKLEPEQPGLQVTAKPEEPKPAQLPVAKPVSVSLVVTEQETSKETAESQPEPPSAPPQDAINAKQAEPEPEGIAPEKPETLTERLEKAKAEKPAEPAEAKGEEPPVQPPVEPQATQPEERAEEPEEKPREPEKEPLKLADIAKLELPARSKAKAGDNTKPSDELAPQTAKPAATGELITKRPAPPPLQKDSGKPVADVPDFLKSGPAKPPEDPEPEAKDAEHLKAKPPEPRRSGLSRFRGRGGKTAATTKRRGSFALPAALTVLACGAFGLAYWVSDWRPASDSGEPAESLARIEPETKPPEAPDTPEVAMPDVPLPDRPDRQLARESQEPPPTPPEAAPPEPPEAVAARAPEPGDITLDEPMVITPPAASDTGEGEQADTLRPGDVAAIPSEAGQQGLADSLSDDDAWNRAVALGTREALQVYLDAHPNGAHVPEAETRLENLILAAAEAEIARLIASDDAAWSEALASGTREALQSYLDEHPGGRHTEEAQRRLAAFGSQTMDRPVPERAPARSPNAASMTAPGSDRIDSQP